MVYYLKYRPQTLSEIDNSQVAEKISRYLAKDELPHAFLFTGNKGTGKTSTARIIAKSLNCKSPKSKNTACGKCSICLDIAQGNNLDILEIDAASNRGIDEIRDLREKIKLAPTNLTFKVYIIDEVHMLTTEAFNALLKTLEEPPRHAVFILATTEMHKIPDTILSRCIKIDFGRATNEDIIHSLSRIVKGEKLEVDQQTLAEIAKIADGSFRDAAKILEEAALTGKSVSLEKIKQITGQSEAALETEFIEMLRQKQAKRLLELIFKIQNQGQNVRQFFFTVLQRLQKLLVSEYLDGSKTQWKKNDLLLAIRLLSQAFGELKNAVIATLPFELAMVEFCENQDLPKNLEPNMPPKIDKTSPKSAPVAADDTVAPIITKWDELLQVLKPLNHSLVGVLRSCRPLKYQDQQLTIEAAYKFHADRLNDAKTREILANAIKNMVGWEGIKLNIIIKQR